MNRFFFVLQPDEIKSLPSDRLEHFIDRDFKGDIAAWMDSVDIDFRKYFTVSMVEDSFAAGNFDIIAVGKQIGRAHV